MSKDMDGQLTLSQKVVDVVDRASRTIFVSLLRYKADKPEISHAEVRIFAGEREDEKFHQIVYINFELEEFIYLLAVLNSLYDIVNTKQPIRNVL